MPLSSKVTSLGNRPQSRILTGDNGVLSNTNATFRPTNIPGLQAWYDMSNTSSYITATGVKLLGDLSGNSNTNVLALNGVAGNYASSPDSAALSITGDIDIRCDVALADWTPTTFQALVSKFNGAGNQVSYSLGVLGSGLLRFTGSVLGSIQVNADSSVVTNISDFSRSWVRVTYRASDQRVQFFLSQDGVNFTQLGTDVTATGLTALFDSTTALTIGSIPTSSLYSTGNIYRAQIYNGINGTLAFDANFATAAKLATSFTESSTNAATVTINTTGDLGARICGARDLVNLTGANQPTLSGGGALFNGTTQYLKAAAFALAQPTTVYFVGQQVTWTNNEGIYDGAALNSIRANQADTTPGIRLRSGASLLAQNNDLAVGTNGVITAVFNSASSVFRVNKLTATTGTIGTTAANGFTLASQGDVGGGLSNILVLGVLIYNTAHDTATQNRVISFLGQKYGIAVG